MKSIIQSKNECLICKTTNNLHTHHIMNGPSRKRSEKFGGVVTLCAYHHNMGGKMCVHGNPTYAKNLKKIYQYNFEKLYGKDLWMNTFKKNYLTEEDYDEISRFPSICDSDVNLYITGNWNRSSD